MIFQSDKYESDKGGKVLARHEFGIMQYRANGSKLVYLCKMTPTQIKLFMLSLKV